MQFTLSLWHEREGTIIKGRMLKAENYDVGALQWGEECLEYLTGRWERFQAWQESSVHMLLPNRSWGLKIKEHAHFDCSLVGRRGDEHISQGQKMLWHDFLPCVEEQEEEFVPLAWRRSRLLKHVCTMATMFIQSHTNFGERNWSTSTPGLLRHIQGQRDMNN